uniref:Energy transducer TonB n=1 Tax=Phenylobacterium glaciei TaxID=2803784 RepID=A0A974P4W4_9CAUL|nr:energy transducer TonB [Phenylobacterium glaciei]
MGLAAFAVAGAARADPPRMSPPDWVARPDAEALADHYPGLARTLAIEGRATLSCTVDLKGRLQTCVSVAASPAGLGFDKAALAMSKLFAMQPKRVDGKPVAGGTVRIPIRFALPAPGQGEPEPSRPRQLWTPRAAPERHLRTAGPGPDGGPGQDRGRQRRTHGAGPGPGRPGRRAGGGRAPGRRGRRAQHRRDPEPGGGGAVAGLSQGSGAADAERRGAADEPGLRRGAGDPYPAGAGPGPRHLLRPPGLQQRRHPA